jgi:uncharacterized membrane protein
MARTEAWRRGTRIGLTIFYAIAGVFHILLPAPFLSITPDWVPFPHIVIALTGACELAGAAGLLLPRFRRYAAIGLALYAVCVFPANIKHAIDSLVVHEPTIRAWLYHIPRLALQPVIVWLALFAKS